MAAKCGAIIKTNSQLQNAFLYARGRFFHTSSVCSTVQSGKVKISPKQDKPVTYEQAFSPPSIAARKAWNSWNNTTLEGGRRTAETAIEDLFIRKFMTGTFTTLIASEVIIKRQHNIIRIAAIVLARLSEERLCFLIGYTEELLSHWLHCNVKLELQIIHKKEDIIFKYV